MDFGLQGKWALVCAASKGLGKGCARALVGEGVNVVITARGAEALVAMKGVHPDAELAELPASVEVEEILALAVPFLDGARHLVVMRRRA